MKNLPNMSKQGVSRALVITRPPEIITCLLIAHPLCDVFVVFDSHPRPTHPLGAAFFFCSSITSAAQYLADLFPVDARLLSPDSGLQWQAELLAHVSGHFFECSPGEMSMSRDAESAFIEASCAILLAKVQESEKESENNFLRAENERLTQELEQAEEEAKVLKNERRSFLREHAELCELRKIVSTSSE